MRHRVTPPNRGSCPGRATSEYGALPRSIRCATRSSAFRCRVTVTSGDRYIARDRLRWGRHDPVGDAHHRDPEIDTKVSAPRHDIRHRRTGGWTGQGRARDAASSRRDHRVVRYPSIMLRPRAVAESERQIYRICCGVRLSRRTIRQQRAISARRGKLTVSMTSMLGDRSSGGPCATPLAG